MMESKHTPGPWHYAPDTLVGPMIGANGCITTLNHNGHRSEAEAEANAHLIAAAPDMYEALQAATFALEGALVLLRKVDGLASSGHMRGFEAAYMNGARALAKAEGR